jgi:hypothetical protein
VPLFLTENKVNIWIYNNSLVCRCKPEESIASAQGPHSSAIYILKHAHVFCYEHYFMWEHLTEHRKLQELYRAAMWQSYD